MQIDQEMFTISLKLNKSALKMHCIMDSWQAAWNVIELLLLQSSFRGLKSLCCPIPCCCSSFKIWLLQFSAFTSWRRHFNASLQQASAETKEGISKGYIMDWLVSSKDVPAVGKFAFLDGGNNTNREESQEKFIQLSDPYENPSVLGCFRHLLHYANNWWDIELSSIKTGLITRYQGLWKCKQVNDGFALDKTSQSSPQSQGRRPGQPCNAKN